VRARTKALLLLCSSSSYRTHCLNFVCAFFVMRCVWALLTLLQLSEALINTGGVIETVAVQLIKLVLKNPKEASVVCR
jgi:hypothetical protein